MKRTNHIILIIVIFASCKNAPSTIKASNGGNGFGDGIPISNGLIGKVFLLPENTSALPDFDTMKPTGNNIYTQKIDIPTQSWSAGFPGSPNLVEWFGIEYASSFKPTTPGNYTFRLESDDGSKLYIDNKLLIDNDGVHNTASKSENIFLNNAMHEIKIRYFQGPRYLIALQLFWSLNNSREQIFPGNNFILFTPKQSHNYWWLLLVALIIALIFFGFKKRNKKNQSIT